MGVWFAALLALAFGVVAYADGERPTFAANTDIQGPTKEVVLSFHPKDDGAKLLDGWRKTYARYKVRNGRVEVYADGRPLVGLLTKAGLSIDLRDADGKTVLARLLRKKGGYQLLDGAGKLLYAVRAAPGGCAFRVDDAGGMRVGSVEVVSGAVRVDGADGKRRYLAERGLGPEAAACFLFDAVPLVWRGAFAFQLQREARKR